MKDSPNLDLLRTIAVLLVVLSHASPFIGGQDLVDSFNFYTFGRVGVALFFVHTSLVLMMSIERHGAGALPFLVRRFFRIYPLSSFMVIVVALLHTRFDEPVDAATVISNVLLVQNFTGHISIPDQLWTLPFEMNMYLFLPALFLLVTRTRRPLLWVALLCACALSLGFVLFFTIWHARTDAVTPLHYIPCFLPGVLAYALRKRWHATWSPVVLFSFVAVAAVSVPMLVTYYGFPETPLFWVMCTVLGLLIPACRQITSRPLARASHVVATYSYGIYLTHVLALWLGFAGLMASQPGYAQWGMSLLMLAGLPFAVYRVVEEPGVRFGRKLADRIARVSARVPYRSGPA